MTRRAAALVVVAISLGLAGCGGGGGDDGQDEARHPVVGEIAPAVAALEVLLGGPQEYFEINATPQFVNLFVALENATQTVAYVYVDGELGPAGPAEAAQGTTFRATSIDIDPVAILDGMTGELPESAVVVFSVVGGPDGGVQYAATVQSVEGGVLDVVLGPDGEVQSVTPG